MVNFSNLAIKKIVGLRIYEEDIKNEQYIDIDYITQDGEKKKLIFSDSSDSVHNEGTFDVYCSLISIIYFIFDKMDRREEFYACMFKAGYEVFRRGYYYLGLKSIHTGNVINIKLGDELKHLLKIENSVITKAMGSIDPFKAWDETLNGFVVLADNDLKLHHCYKFDQDLLWDPQYSLNRTYNFQIEKGKIIDKTEEFSILSEKVGIFIPLTNVTVASLNLLRVSMDKFPSCDYNVLLEVKPTDIGDNQSPASILLREMSVDYSNLRIFCKLKGIKPDNTYKTKDELVVDVEEWESLFTELDDDGEIEFNHIGGYVLESIPNYPLVDGQIDPNEIQGIMDVYGAFRKWLHDKNQYVILKSKTVPVQWYGKSNIPFDAYWNYWGDKLDVNDESAYGRTYLNTRKIITITNQVSPSLDEDFTKRLEGFAKMLYITNEADFNTVSQFLDDIAEYCVKRNELLLNKSLLVDNEPLTQDEITAQGDYIDKANWIPKDIDEVITLPDQTTTTVTTKRLVRK